MGISVDSVAVQRAFSSTLGNISYPLLADFHPKGKVSRLYGVYNEERGVGVRSVFVIDKKGFVQFKRIYAQGLPDPAEILREVESLG